MFVTTVNPIRKMSYHYYLKRPKPVHEMVLNRIFDKNPHLTNALDRLKSNPLFRKNSPQFLYK